MNELWIAFCFLSNDEKCHFVPLHNFLNPQKSHFVPIINLPMKPIFKFFIQLIFLTSLPKSSAQDVRFIDISKDFERQVIVDKEKDQYLGHPTTTLLKDGKTVLCVYPKGHGKGAIVYKKSSDGGKSWSNRIQTPNNWASSKEVPTLFQVKDQNGKERIIMFSGLYPIRMATSENNGITWSELSPIGDFGGIVAMGTMIEDLHNPGHYRALFHDDGRFITKEPKKQNPIIFTLWSSLSTDGGMTWGKPQNIYRSSSIHLCEPGAIRSPDKKQLAVLLRENSRQKNSYLILSNDEGKTWSKPKELPITLTGDRHTAKYLPDGRLFISFRCKTAIGSKLGVDKSPVPHEGDWAAWIGTYKDIIKGNPGQYVIKIADNKKGWDTTYPGVELLIDGTILTTTYGHWETGEAPYIISVRIKSQEIDELAKESKILKIEKRSMRLK